MEQAKVAPQHRLKAAPCRSRLRVRRPRFLRAGYLRNAASFLAFTALYAGTNLALFGWRVWQYRDRALLEQMARGTGFCLNFDCAMVLVLVLRRMLTWLRSRHVGQLLPLEHHIYLHKMAGWSVYILSAAHTLFHMANFVNMSQSSGVTVQDYLFDTSMGIGWFAGSANITGLALLVILTIMVICSHRAVRKSGYFEIFYWTHLLSIPTWVLLILHSPNFWKWFLVPGALFALEVACRVSRVCSDRGRSTVTAATLLPSEVVRLTVSRPPDFVFRPGDFCYVNIPAVAKYEWHPFTISSSPENEDQITFHVRAVGEWTRSLHDKVLEACLKSFLYDQFVLMKATATPHPGPSDLVCPQLAPPTPATVAPPPAQRKSGVTAVTPEQLQRLEWLRQAQAESAPHGFSCQNPAADGPSGLHNAGFVGDERVDPVRTVSAQVSEATVGAGGCGGGSAKRREAEGPAKRREAEGSAKRIEAEGCQRPAPGPGTVAGCRTGSVREAGAVHKQHSLQKGTVDKLSWKIILDGPYGAPSTSVFHAQHAVLVGGGIGVTPFASVLHCIMDRYNAAHRPCPHCLVPTCLEMPSSMLKLKKVDFVWVNRDMRSFEWFLELLHQLRESQQRRGSQLDSFLTMQLHKTSSLPIVGAVPLRNEVKQGRPDWDKVFGQIRDRRRGKVTVFFCGPPALGRVIREKAAKFGFGFVKEMF
ncbi:NADPH oxidase 5-like [Amphibalanus amphitrite]|uniref:NADPH oxidase 5-like n=1 Tax=Amphibalanus amphitrite TaxID=1232801 RepID=UPI001C9206A5|nr:NADPH oxidase 5-like [Amphibalanus amphitrite]